jgi:hypothetical protein
MLLCTVSLQNWLELSLSHGLPSSLLLLSRAFTLTTPTPRVATGRPGAADELGRVKETLLTLPEEVIKDVGLEVAAPTSSKCYRVVLVPRRVGGRGRGSSSVAVHTETLLTLHEEVIKDVGLEVAAPTSSK